MGSPGRLHLTREVTAQHWVLNTSWVALLAGPWVPALVCRLHLCTSPQGRPGTYLISKQGCPSPRPASPSS